MYYRRKILIKLISNCGGQLEKLRLQKLLLLFCSRQEKPAYSFIPYKYGGFSFQANADLTNMENKGLMKSTETTWILDYENAKEVDLLPSDELKLELVCSKYASLQTDDLIKHTYVTYPYYAINSIIVDKLLSEEQKNVVYRSVSRDDTTCLFTIGYEGRALEEFLNVLKKKNIKVLCDVRKNAMSMKYGFSKKTLSNATRNIGIEYQHFPDLGIESSERKTLVTAKDYNDLFTKYQSGVILKTRKKQMLILQLVEDKKRVALMCFEKEPWMCHRSRLAEAIINLSNRKLNLTHL